MYRQSLLLRRQFTPLINPNSFSTAISTNGPVVSAIPSASKEKLKKINRAMTAYLDQAKARDVFIKREGAEYELGKRHLANMMGVDANTMTKEDVDKAIVYLFPSGLFSLGARPMMKAPEDLYPPQKPVQFDEDGRPYHSMFYTRFPNFYQILYDIRSKIQKLQAYEDHQLAKGAATPTEPVSLAGTDWLTTDQISKLTLETVTDDHRAQFVAAAENLLAQPYSFLEADFIKQYRSSMGVLVGKEMEQMRDEVLATLTVDENGRKTVTAKGYRLKSQCTVKLTDGGSGKVLIEGKSMDIFRFQQSRENILFPFVLLKRLGQFDVESTYLSLTGRSKWDPHAIPPDRNFPVSGESIVSGATRHGISLALLAFVTPEEAEKMRLAGLISRDLRVRERMKIGQKGARAKWTWSKR